MSTQIPVILKSQHVCAYCHARKQRCDKALPSCSRCASKMLSCHYGSVAGKSLAKEPGTASVSRLIERRGDCCSPDLSQIGTKELLLAACGIDDDGVPSMTGLIYDFLDASRISLLDLADEYFATVHRWLPIINGSSFYRRIHSSRWPNDDQFALLVYSIFLVTRLPCASGRHSMRTQLYRILSRVFVMQASENATLELLQTGLLIAVYSCGHGMAREAFMILSTCAAVVRLLEAEKSLDNCGNYQDAELEACWGALALLDSINAVCCIQSITPLALPPEQPSTSVPPNCDVDGPFESFRAISSIAQRIRPALYYLHDAKNAKEAHDTYNTVCVDLQFLVCDLLNASNSKARIYCESNAFAVSTRFVVQSSHASVRALDFISHDLPVIKSALELRSTLRMVIDMARAATATLREQDGQPARVSFVGLCAVFRAAVLAVRLDGGAMGEEDLDALKEGLRMFGIRWGIAGVYERHLDE
ncbi:uncharacterized protein BDZ99DRAFT_577032 [Mytilinidion resinicola]|uniref:Zn(2)-C6 fungal-type domain-containing protein n=1 Tax=Mytilinidion resinicola TaxID=574789 RepID=A0A6A6Y073_9PEZI|nr:uncharacterized protein BDZ99DRAFT_577032 [Mytilinidion resinicola]KAF2802049.1 hypothetical protein BDZ99DRAFT_577032 [Mytilinidion resinicola]